ncbi:MAG: S8 family serine peptidase [Pseudomonadaceae bacterium]|nr:S8 family serine peptidase [Pseudomonadaceae bacterium]
MASLELRLDGIPSEGVIEISENEIHTWNRTDAAGRIDFPTLDTSAQNLIILANPRDGGWKTVVVGYPPNGVIDCQSFGPYTSSPWWLDVLNLNDKSSTQNRMKIGVVDTDFGDPHPWVEDARVKGRSIGTPQIDPPHGRMIASLIANSSGFDPCGACPEAELYVHSASMSGDPEGVDLVEAINGIVTLTDAGVDIITMSFGLPGNSDLGLDNALEYAQMNGVLLIAASGNEGNFTPSYPASHESVIAVGAVTDARLLPQESFVLLSMVDYRREDVASLVSMGLDMWPMSNWVGVDGVIAPGTGVVVDCEDRRIDVFGTSFSAPLVAAVAARMFAKEPPPSRSIETHNTRKARIMSNCFDLGLDAKMGGRGMPVL